MAAIRHGEIPDQGGQRPGGRGEGQRGHDQRPQDRDAKGVRDEVSGSGSPRLVARAGSGVTRRLFAIRADVVRAPGGPTWPLRVARWLAGRSEEVRAAGLVAVALVAAGAALGAAVGAQSGLLGRVVVPAASTVLLAWVVVAGAVWIDQTWPRSRLWRRGAGRDGQSGPERSSAGAPGGAGRSGSRSALTRWLDAQVVTVPPSVQWPGLVTPVLVVGVAAAAIALVWVRSGPWQLAVALAVPALLADGGPGRRVASAGGRVAAVLRRARGAPVARIARWPAVGRLWAEIHPTARAALVMLVVANVVVAAALLQVDLLAFVALALVDFVVLQRMTRALRDPAAPRAPVPVCSRLETAPSSPPPPDGRGDPGGADPPAPRTPDAASSPVEGEAEPEDPRGASEPGRAEKVRTVVAGVAVVAAVGWIAIAHPGPLLIPVVLVLGLAIPLTTGVTWDQTVRMVLAVAVAATAVDYVSWRVLVTNWHGWWIAVPLLGAEAFGALHVLGFQVTLWPLAPPVVRAREDPVSHPIFILVPTVNEGPAILRPTLEACLVARARYLEANPSGRVRIIVCNDGRVAGIPNWRAVVGLARELRVACVSRRVGGGAKAGNLENARRVFHIGGDALVAIFDADQVPQPDFLVKTIPPFSDPDMGWVQSGQYYANVDNPVARWADDQQSMFYNVLCPGKAAQNAAFICGTNVVVRAAALDEIGGLPLSSVTEDFAASIALHPRWKSIYLTDVLATGLGPLDLPSYLKQQSRWALGTLGVFWDHWRDILLPRRHGLRALQRVQYFLACTHYVSGLRDLIYVVSPVLFILTGIPAVRSATIGQYLLHFLPYALLSAAAVWYSGRDLTGLRGIVIGFASFPVLVASLAGVILRRKVPFAVTSKAHRDHQPLGYLGIYAAFVLLCIGALVWATQVRGQQATSLLISVIWVAYSLVMLGSFLWLAGADYRFHAQRAPDALVRPATLAPAYPAKLAERPAALLPARNVVMASLVATPILLAGVLGSLPGLAAGPAPAFTVATTRQGPPELGFSVPAAEVSHVPALAQEVGVAVTIVGRTQDITDRFRTGWAEGLAQQGAVPWITLQFGEMGPGGRPPLDANLPAIVNGVDDAAITRWAREIAAFAKPVYLTILPQVDKNWAVSSAVANGGIPEDVPKAWAHVQAIFRAAGAANVAWVWAPADPLHDQRFAPPPSTIDAVLQPFVNYPGTTWGDPARALAELSRRYPHTPIMVDATAAGPAAQKAAWIRSLAQAVAGTPQVVAVLYHEAGPDLDPSAAQARAWSVDSDPTSLGAWRALVGALDASSTAHPAKAAR